MNQTDECGQSETGLHCWMHADAKGISVRKCKHCGKLEACYTEQAYSLWGYVPEGYTLIEFD